MPRIHDYELFLYQQDHAKSPEKKEWSHKSRYYRKKRISKTSKASRRYAQANDRIRDKHKFS